MNPKKIVGAALFTAMLAGGGVAGALIGVPSLSGAATGGSTTTTAPATSGNSSAKPAPDGAMRVGPGLDAAAKALGMSTTDLKAALHDGKTIADIAGDKGVDVQKVIDAMVAADSAAIDQHAAGAKSKLPERVKDQVNGTLRDGQGMRQGIRQRAPRVELGAAAEALGVTREDLRTSLRDGKTITDVAGDKGVDVQKVIDAMTVAPDKLVDKAVAAGKLTTEQGVQRKADLKARITLFVNKGFEGGAPFGRGQRHR